MGNPWLAAPGVLFLTALTPPPLRGPPVADGAGNWSLAFEPQGPLPARGENRPVRYCIADRSWCAEIRRDGESGLWSLDIFERASAAPRRLILSGQEGGGVGFGLGRRLMREAGGAVLIAVERSRSTSFSGGGASASALLLVRAEPGAAPAVEVLDVPERGHATIRACFSRGDERARAGACHDEYELAGGFALDLATRAGRPRFILTASARTYPGRRSRSEDSATAPRLGRSDLVWAPDPACSYRRILAFDPASGRYLPDAPLPDCADYFDF